MARQTRSGVAGISTCSTPISASASTMALTTAVSAGMVPPSPPPRRPSGLELDSTSLISVASCLAAGTRLPLIRLIGSRRSPEVRARVIDRADLLHAEGLDKGSACPLNVSGRKRDVLDLRRGRPPSQSPDPPAAAATAGS